MTQPGSSEACLQIRVENLTRGQTLVTAGRVADTFCSRLRGRVGSKPLCGSSACPGRQVFTLFWPIRGLENGAHLKGCKCLCRSDNS